MHKMKKLFAALSILAASSSVYCASNLLVCPAVDALAKDPSTNIWQAKPDWQGSPQPLVDKIDRFIGAQWTGVSVGQLCCLYAGVEAGTFPVAICSNTIVYEPDTKNWQRVHDNEGYHWSCKANDPASCVAKPRVRVDGGDYYQQALSLQPLK